MNKRALDQKLLDKSSKYLANRRRTRSIFAQQTDNTDDSLSDTQEFSDTQEQSQDDTPLQQVSVTSDTTTSHSSIQSTHEHTMADGTSNTNNLLSVEYIEQKKFDGRGSLRVRDFVASVKSSVAATGLSQVERDAKCLAVAKNRLDVSNVRVGDFLRLFEGRPAEGQTWEIFQQKIINAFDFVTESPLVLLGDVFQMRPASLDLPDVTYFSYDLQLRLQSWAKLQSTSPSQTELCKSVLDINKSDKEVAEIVKAILLLTIPADKRNYVGTKLAKTDLDSIPRVFSELAANLKTSITPQVLVAQTSTENKQAYPHTARAQGHSYNAPNTYNNSGHSTNSPHRYNTNNNSQRQPYAPRAHGPRPYSPRHQKQQVQLHKQWMPKRGQCFVCLNFGHRAGDCRGQARCPLHGPLATVGHSFASCLKYPDEYHRITDEIRKWRWGAQQGRSVFFHETSPDHLTEYNNRMQELNDLNEEM